MRAWIMVGPLMLVAVLQVGGCTSAPAADDVAPSGGVYRSTSAGALFEQSVTLANPLEDEPAYIARYVLKDAFRPSFKPTTIYVAAGAQGYVLSEDDGVTWRHITVPLASVLDIVALENGIVVVTGIDGEGQGYIMRSGDAGKSWQTVLTVPVPAKTNNLSAISIGQSEVATIIISIAPDPFNTNRVYAGTTLGNVFVGEQSAKVWRAIHSVDNDVFSSNQPKFAVADIIPSPHRANEFLIITTLGKLYAIDSTGKQTEIKIPQHIGAGPIVGIGQTKTVLNATFIKQFPDALLVGVNDGAVLSRDRGVTWEQLTLPVDTIRRFNTVIVMASPTNPDRIFVAINDAVYRSEDGGGSWNTFSFSLPNHVISDLLINPVTPANVVAVTTPLSS